MGLLDWLRRTFLGGVGTWLAKSDELTVKVETAPAATWLNYRSEDRDDEWVFEWIFALWGEWKAAKYLTVKQWVRVIPRVSDLPEYRLNWQTDLESPLSDKLAATLTFRWDYNTDPAPGVERTDIKILLSLTYRF